MAVKAEDVFAASDETTLEAERLVDAEAPEDRAETDGKTVLETEELTVVGDIDEVELAAAEDEENKEIMGAAESSDVVESGGVASATGLKDTAVFSHTLLFGC